MMRVTIALIVMALASCGTTETKSNNTNGNNGSTNSGTNGSTNSGTNGSTNSGTTAVPQEHRVTAEQCDNERDPGLVGGVPNGQECADDSECTDGDNGRCVQGRITECSYDLCFNDSDCGADEVCRCGVGLGANVCLPGNCHTDSDCGDSGYCSPSQGDCGNYLGVVGYFCHTPEDECINDSDCGEEFNSSCRFDPALSHWACSDSQCVG